MTSLFLIQLGNDISNIASSLGANLSNVITHLATLLNGTV
jgi:hypothetical protein